VKPGTVVLEIERIVAGGFGLAHSPDGVVLVRGALPGERVTARPARKAGTLRAHAIEILEPHPARVGMPAPGADLPLEYEDQLPVKHGLVTEALARIAKIDADVEPVVPSPRELGYRTAAQYAVAAEGLGARALDSDKVVPLESDPLACAPIARAFEELSGKSLHGIDEVLFRASLHEDRVVAGFVGAQPKAAERLARGLRHVAGAVWGAPDPNGRLRGKVSILEGSDRLLEDFGGVRATVTVQSFAQVNPLAAGALYRDAAAAAGTGARAIDLYAGSGVLGAHLRASYDDVVAVEISADAVKRGEADARRFGTGVRFHRGDARAAARFFPADLVALDPPRAGASKDVIALLCDRAPARILYVSCDPTTWARDVGLLCAQGYRLRLARPYDFYPYTHHVEVLSVLERA
jgi:23S rRNA (uracil1939-C5)-methyltransferase